MSIYYWKGDIETVYGGRGTILCCRSGKINPVYFKEKYWTSGLIINITRGSSCGRKGDTVVAI